MEEEKKSQDCYWYIKKDVDGDDAISALCVPCAKKLDTGWFWKGNELGYGNYDLNCSNCGSVIHKKHEEI